MTKTDEIKSAIVSLSIRTSIPWKQGPTRLHELLMIIGCLCVYTPHQGC